MELRLLLSMSKEIALLSKIMSKSLISHNAEQVESAAIEIEKLAGSVVAEMQTNGID